jgi:hypothetical protein
MTALRYNKPMMSGLRKAGRLFGLDLASLFDETKTAKLQVVISLPLFSFKRLQKEEVRHYTFVRSSRAQ